MNSKIKPPKFGYTVRASQIRKGQQVWRKGEEIIDLLDYFKKKSIDDISSILKTNKIAQKTNNQYNKKKGKKIESQQLSNNNKTHIYETITRTIIAKQPRTCFDRL